MKEVGMNRIYGDRLHREEYVEKIVELIKLRSESKESTSFSIGSMGARQDMAY